MLSALVDYWVAIVVGVICLTVLTYALRARITNARFGVRQTGGRGGMLVIALPTCVAQVEFEIGGSVDLIVYANTLRDGEGGVLSDQQQSEAVCRLWQWASARGLTIDIPGLVPPYEPAV